MKKFALLTLISIMLSGLAGGRTWTSVDGTKTFEGEFVSSSQKTVTLKCGTRPLTFKTELLSKKDQEWIRAESKKRAATDKNKKAAMDFARSDFGKALSKLRKLDGDRFEDYQWQKIPEFFILSYTASRCETCRSKAPQLAQTYHKMIAENARVEFVHLSFDDNEDAALKWAMSFEQPWPILLRDEVAQKQLINPFFPDGQVVLSTVILVDRNGKELARGLEKVLATVLKHEG